MKAIMEIIARTYKINEEYLNKLEMPLRLVCLEWVRLQSIEFEAPFIENRRHAKSAWVKRNATIWMQL